jgi:hypothetical protein
MTYNYKELVHVIDEATSFITKRIQSSNAQGILYEYLKELGLEHIVESQNHYKFVVPNRSKILVLAYKLNKDQLALEAKKQGFDSNRIEFIEYHSGFNIKNLEYSQVYTDILVGPIPHKAINMGDESSLIASIENSPEKYPRLHKLSNSNGELKVTKTAFRETLYKTVFFEECM